MTFEPLLALGLIAIVIGLVLVFGWPRLTWPAFATGLIAIVLGAGAILWRAAIVLAAIALLVPLTAFAADGSVVPVGPIVSSVRPVIETVLTVLVGAGMLWLAYLAHRFFGVSIDEKFRNALQGAIVNGIHGELDRLQVRADRATIDVKSPTVARVIDYVRAYSPEAAAHFGLTTPDLEKLVKAQIGKLAPPALPSSPRVGGLG